MDWSRRRALLIEILAATAICLASQYMNNYVERRLRSGHS